jgi:glucokinase
VGGGVVVNGQLLTGAFGIAGELGHLRVRADGPPCVCGSDGCLAVYASGTAMLKRFRQLAGDPSATAADLSEQARDGRETAIQVVTEAASAIASASAQISRVIDHQALILGGGASGIGATLAEAVRKAILATEPVGPIRPLPDVLLARAGSRAGVIGAADLAALETSSV